MTIIPNWTTFRHTFAQTVSEAVTVSFVAGAPGTITRAAGDFNAFFQVGMSIDIGGSVSNSFRFTIDSIQAAGTFITLVASDILVNEGPVAVTIDGAFRDVDTIETWPLNLVRLAGSGFGDVGNTIAGIPTPYVGQLFTITANAGVADAVLGADEYDWYLSQRTDEGAIQYLTFAQTPNSGGDSFSGSVTIVHSPTATNVLKVAVPPTPQQVTWLFKHVDIYVQRRSDGAIQWRSLLRAMVATAAA